MELSYEELVEWCALLTGDSTVYFERLDRAKLEEIYLTNLKKDSEEL